MLVPASLPWSIAIAARDPALARRLGLCRRLWFEWINVGGRAAVQRLDDHGHDSKTAEIETANPALVGRWKRVNKCPELVKALEDSGLGAIAPSLLGDYFPEAPPEELARKHDLVKGQAHRSLPLLR